MAKALLGYMSSSTDPRVVAQLTAETRRLKQKVSDLEAHILRLQAENDLLAPAGHDAQPRAPGESMQPAWAWLGCRSFGDRRCGAPRADDVRGVRLLRRPRGRRVRPPAGRLRPGAGGRGGGVRPRSAR